MGGHGGLNILPQKRWNVYNFDNREKVRLDEEAAAKEEQLKREQSRKRDSELRLQQLRQARGLPPTQAEAEAEAEPDDHNKPSSSKSIQPATSSSSSPEERSPERKSGSDSNHINLFEGIRIFDPIKAGDNDGKRDRKKGRFDRSDEKKKVKKEEVRVVGPEDEKYRLGYGIAGKGVKLPWYMEKKVSDVKKGGDESDDDENVRLKKRKVEGKKSLEELREERLNRERKEKERERALIMGKSRRDDGSSYHRRR